MLVALQIFPKQSAVFSLTQENQSRKKSLAKDLQIWSHHLPIKNLQCLPNALGGGGGKGVENPNLLIWPTGLMFTVFDLDF